MQWGWPANCKVHPAPLYELMIWCAIGAFLWQMGTKVLKSPNTRTKAGTIFCSYLILTGMARFLVEIIRINPRSFLGMTNAQVAGLASVIAGVALLLFVKSRKPPQAAATQDPFRKSPATPGNAVLLQHLAKDVLQDAAVTIVGDFFGSVHADARLEGFDFAVGGFGVDGGFFAWRQSSHTFNVEDFVAGEARAIREFRRGGIPGEGRPCRRDCCGECARSFPR